jgi:hypothetical protein
MLGENSEITTATRSEVKPTSWLKNRTEMARVAMPIRVIQRLRSRAMSVATAAPPGTGVVCAAVVSARLVCDPSVPISSG